MRIVSLVPSLTELLIDLKLENDLVGRTKFCIHPVNRINSIPKIGGTKKVNRAAIADLKPDLIIANKEENTKEDVDALSKFATVHVTDISNYYEALASIQKIGQITHRKEESLLLISQIKLSFSNLEIATDKSKSVCYLIWKDPLMTIGRDTFIHDMLNKCGLQNVFSHQKRYPTLTIADIKNKKPSYIFLSSEPYPFKEKHIQEFEENFPESKVILVDGEYFSWYGSRMVLAADYFMKLLKDLK